MLIGDYAKLLWEAQAPNCFLDSQALTIRQPERNNSHPTQGNKASQEHAPILSHNLRVLAFVKSSDEFVALDVASVKPVSATITSEVVGRVQKKIHRVPRMAAATESHF